MIFVSMGFFRQCCRVGDEKKEVEKDSIVHSPAKIIHCWHNESDTPLRILVAKTPKPKESTKFYSNSSWVVMPVSSGDHEHLSALAFQGSLSSAPRLLQNLSFDLWITQTLLFL